MIKDTTASAGILLTVLSISLTSALSSTESSKRVSLLCRLWARSCDSVFAGGDPGCLASHTACTVPANQLHHISRLLTLLVTFPSKFNTDTTLSDSELEYSKLSTISILVTGLT